MNLTLCQDSTNSRRQLPRKCVASTPKTHCSEVPPILCSQVIMMDVGADWNSWPLPLKFLVEVPIDSLARLIGNFFGERVTQETVA